MEFDAVRLLTSSCAVRDAYAMALRLSFVTAIVASGILLILMIPMKLPRLRKGEQMNVAGGD